MEKLKKSYTDSDGKPYPVRLCDLKRPLMMEAAEADHSIHWVIKKILREHLSKKYRSLQIKKTA
ncbi:MAG TPA: hypothetical protein VK666_07925 [Chryseolinea sp.]|nr:hypothetical protein [Chryseolinea sp.]